MATVTIWSSLIDRKKELKNIWRRGAKTVFSIMQSSAIESFNVFYGKKLDLIKYIAAPDL